LIGLYRKAREVPGVKKVLVASGLRYDLASTSPEYVRELATHHVGGYLKIAPEHTEDGPLSKMLKPGIGTFEKFRALFDRYSREAGKKQYLIPYFIAAHPGTTDTDMLHLAEWLKKNGFRADQVQAFLPSPMATATAMYHTGRNPLRPLRFDQRVEVPRSPRTRTLHKAFLRYHDPANWPLLRQALRRMGRSDLIGHAPHQLVPLHQPAVAGPPSPGHAFRTQHTHGVAPPPQGAAAGPLRDPHGVASRRGRSSKAGPPQPAASPPQGASEGPLRDPPGVASRRGRSSKAGPPRPAASPPQGASEGPLRDPSGVASRRGRSSKAGPPHP